MVNDTPRADPTLALLDEIRAIHKLLKRPVQIIDIAIVLAVLGGYVVFITNL
jgi:hypothetical protein